MQNNNTANSSAAQLKVFEKCTNFYFETEKIPSKF